MAGWDSASLCVKLLELCFHSTFCILWFSVPYHLPLTTTLFCIVSLYFLPSYSLTWLFPLPVWRFSHLLFSFPRYIPSPHSMHTHFHFHKQVRHPFYTFNDIHHNWHASFFPHPLYYPHISYYFLLAITTQNLILISLPSSFLYVSKVITYSTRPHPSRLVASKYFGTFACLFSCCCFLMLYIWNIILGVGYKIYILLLPFFSLVFISDHTFLLSWTTLCMVFSSPIFITIFYPPHCSSSTVFYIHLQSTWLSRMLSQKTHPFFPLVCSPDSIFLFLQIVFFTTIAHFHLQSFF